MKTETASSRKNQLTLQGMGVSPGIVVGKALVLEEKPDVVFCFEIAERITEPEVARFEQAVASTVESLKRLKKKLAGEVGEGHDWLLDVHLLMLEDDLLIKEVIRYIREDRINADWALKKAIGDLRKKFTKVDDEYFQERQQDLEDVGKRIQRHLSAKESETIPGLGGPFVLVASDMSPSETVQLYKKQFKGLAIDSGSRTSHTSIIAKSLEIPAVVGLHDMSKRVVTGDTLILDGTEGLVIINPTSTTRKTYTNKKRKQTIFRKKLLKTTDEPATTLDGVRFSVRANIEFPWEIESANAHGADGIGLYRTEFLFLNRKGTPPSEEEHFEVYKGIAEQLHPQEAVIRTIDLGGDKFSGLLNQSPQSEPNPILGLRAIRFCLKRRDIFRMQLRAILRASAHGKLKVLFPLISGVDELRQAKTFLEEIKEELRTASIPFDEQIPVGIMIEVPAAACIADLLAREADFFSIGTNDLIQYFLAIDRSNDEVSYLYQPIHPGVIRTLKFVIKAAHDSNIHVSLCGEMAAEPIFAIVLVGMGLDCFSMDPGSIPLIKHLIRSIEYKTAKEITEKISTFSTAREVEAFIVKRINNDFPPTLSRLFEETLR
ncbi:phosphoenolpyruvate--protein phosphotransferase [Acidobacteriota bacterium]